MLILESNKHFKSTHTSGRLMFVCLIFVTKGKILVKSKDMWGVGRKGVIRENSTFSQSKSLLVIYLS